MIKIKKSRKIKKNKMSKLVEQKLNIIVIFEYQYSQDYHESQKKISKIYNLDIMMIINFLCK